MVQAKIGSCLQLKQCGTYTGYNNHGCRGERCRAAKRRYKESKKQNWIMNRARTLALKFLREQRPELWKAIRKQAIREYEDKFERDT